MADRLRVLLVEDDEDDYLLTRDLLADIPGGGHDLEWAASYEAGREAMLRGRFDVVLVDYRLGAHTGLELLAEAEAHKCRAPVILLTGQGEREVDLEAMRAGAADYLVKGKIDADVLERSIRYAVERQRDEDALLRMQAELEDRVRARTADLERADRRKDEFLAMLAHELRNPLAPIRNSLHILRLKCAGDPALEETEAMMTRQVEHMVRLVDDLLDVSRITRGKIRLQVETVNLSTVLTRAVEASRPFIAARHHDLRVTVPPAPLTVRADLTRMAQVVSNLLNNAAKFTPENGTIWLTAERQEAEAVVRVRDTGAGIAPEMLPTIFDLFFQADGTLDRSQGGLGIGLTLVKSLVEMHDGTVQAFSAGSGKGSEFVVHLPLPPQERASRSESSSGGGAAARPAPRRRILIVDDNRDAADSLAKLLELYGNDVRATYDGRQALEALSGHRPDLIILDIGLPGMNGYDVVRHIRGQAPFRDVAVAALTGYGGPDDRRRTAEAGFDYHLVKPVDPAALQDLLARQKPLAE